ncbi:hypothetical protein [Natronobacterium gregoryi]|uniref:Uncharacterized protein n=2 Tax=Natronobacterium gregoryi TaxID=44930 RepID=L0AGS1_NATGS|nr:hypothetical protein [Natronobacterium gregoryi]AFZ73016.1 hypothetical protein Natgr_1825 [Natronobacterium gregoryi SP2]ELY64871.1 hypothetical protein C490_14335 [Natronobacterium gregoryi SP2]PLK18376.1 hypothetical protein CYV19_18055 [Natronobacterium gregoryi SP2]SFJ71593.1 hypothetical protein SAMN05443661_1649 [Natronobacterium gregoryi]
MSSATEQTEADTSHEIGHDEYDPIGTLTLIGLYFVVLVLMWFYTYFIEFLGNDPTVIGSVVTAGGIV